MEKTYDYFKYNYGWYGTEGNNDEVRGLADATTTGHDVINYTNYIFIGYMDNGYSAASPEAIGHEYTHGIISHTSNLNNVAAESGALSESFADIFGTAVERYVRGTNDWIIGTDFGQIRSLINPHDAPEYQPATYHEQGWWYTGSDAGYYVHHNNGVQNHWFYLLSNAIGFDKAIKIAWGTMKILNPDADYQDSRDASIYIARFNYGTVSCEAKAAQNAWAAVGVGDPNNDPCNPPLYINIVGPSSLPSCTSSGTWTAYPTGGTGSYTYKWEFSYNGNYIAIGYSSSLTFTPGGCCGNYLYLRLTVTSGAQHVSTIREVYVPSCYKSTNPKKLSETPAESEIILFPNPADNILNIQIQNIDETAIINLYDLQGKLIISTSTSTKTSSIDVENISKGMYILKVILDNGDINIQKVCVE